VCLDFIQSRSLLTTSSADTATKISSDKSKNQLDHGLAAAVDRQALDEN